MPYLARKRALSPFCMREMSMPVGTTSMPAQSCVMPQSAMSASRIFSVGAMTPSKRLRVTRGAR
jgi:hypothetical protein